MTNVVITGSTQGIGYGLAAEFCNRGDNVTLAGRDQQKLDQALDNLKDKPGKVTGIPCNVTRAEDVQALWDHASTQFGAVDIWINNAGLARTAWQILDVPQREIETMISTNMLGTINGSRVAAAGMKAQGQGKIFNMLGGGSDGEDFPGMGSSVGTLALYSRYLSPCIRIRSPSSNWMPIIRYPVVTAAKSRWL